MSDTKITAEAAPRGYNLKVAAATAAATVAAGTLWASQNMQLAHAERWQDGAIAAGVLALVLAGRARKETPEVSLLRAGLDAAARLRNRIVEAGKAERADKPAKPATRDRPKAPDANPLASERARLLKAGYSESAVEQILIARESAAPATPGLGSGVVTGVLNNLGAVAGHARNILPSLRADLLHLLDDGATAAARVGAAIALALKAAVIVVVGYVVWLEFNQLKAGTERARAEACSARMKAIIDTVPMNHVFEAAERLAKDCPQ